MADDLWSQAKAKFDKAVAIGAYAADQWSDVVTLHRSPSEAIKAIDKKAAELEAASRRKAQKQGY